MFKVALIDKINEYDNNGNAIEKIKVTNVLEVNNLSSLDDMKRYMNVLYILTVNDDVKVGMNYDPNTNTITNELGDQVYPPITPDLVLQKLDKTVKEITFTKDLEGMTLEEVQEYLIKKSKRNLEIYLENHPMKFNKKTYTVTSSKQNQLTELLNAYKFATDIGESFELTWNETGKENEPYTYENLVQLYLAMLNYVRPIVAYQQQIETQIKACDETPKILALDITFEKYNAEK